MQSAVKKINKKGAFAWLACVDLSERSLKSTGVEQGTAHRRCQC